MGLKADHRQGPRLRAASADPIRSTSNTPATSATGGQVPPLKRCCEVRGGDSASSEGKMKPLPFESIINPETGRMRPRLVDVTGEGSSVPNGT